jgi:hypothetical protein
MKNVWVGIAVLLAAFSAFGGVQYEFMQKSQSEIETIPSTELTGRAIIEGDRSRVDFVSSTNSYPPGAYVISTNGSRTLTFVDPVMKSYTEINAGAVAAAIGMSNITVDRLKSDVVKLDDHPEFAGVSTDHYHITIGYDMTVTFRSRALKQSIHTEIDKWTTVMFGDISETFLSNTGVHTGNPQIDQLIDLETTKVKGLPLKQVIRTTMKNLEGSMPNSELKLSPVRTMTREMVITSIRQFSPDAVTFAIPLTYKKSDGEPLKQHQTDVTILSFEPSGQ